MRPDLRSNGRPTHDAGRVVVASMVAGVPDHGGWVWAVMHWVLGLRALGYDVLLLEPAEDLDAAHRVRFASIVSRFGLEDAAATFTPGGEWFGRDAGEIRAWCAHADILFNVAGVLTEPALLGSAPHRVYVDVDPGFTQLWHDDGIDMRLDGHTAHVTVGLNVGSPGCPIPTCGRTWLTTLPPVTIDQWPMTDRVEHDALTTVANWRGYGSVMLGGEQLGQKAHSWRELLPIADRSPVPCAPALAIHPTEESDLAGLDKHGWQLLDPTAVAATPDDYQRFVRASWGELGIAKHGYVAARSGWFSDRSACYLAAGRPVIAQDTGLGGHVPTGEGLLTFDGVDDAADAISEVAADYEHHRAAARDFAERHLDAGRVLTRLIDLVTGDEAR